MKHDHPMGDANRIPFRQTRRLGPDSRLMAEGVKSQLIGKDRDAGKD